MGSGLSSNGEEAGMVLTGPEDELDEEDGADEDEDEDVCTGCFAEDEDEAESEDAVDEEKHLGRNEDVLADVDAVLELSERLRRRPAMLLRQEADADILSTTTAMTWIVVD